MLENFFSVKLIEILTLLNQSLSSAIVIFSFSLLIYLITHNLRSEVAGAFGSLLACVCIAYAGDVALFQVGDMERAIPWLKFQWVGIAFTPAAYLHFSDTLLRMTNSVSRWRRAGVLISYTIGFALLPLAFWTELLVYDGFHIPGATQFRAGPLFWVFTLYFIGVVFSGGYNTYRARRRCLTSTTRRRMAYLTASFAAPAMGVFPYMLIANMPAYLSPNVIQAMLLVGNVGIAIMTMVMAYSVAYFGVLTPDRVVKHNFVHFILRGPMVATLVIFIMLATPESNTIMGLPREVILITSVVAVIVVSQLMIVVAKPAIDRLVYRHDKEEVDWIRQLDRRLLTSADLEQMLENVMAALCEVLRVRSGFIANVSDRSAPRLEAHCGSREFVEEALSGCDVRELVARARKQQEDHFTFMPQGDFWFIALQTRDMTTTLAIVGIEGRSDRAELSQEEQKLVDALLGQAERVMEDRHLQQGVFGALMAVIPEIESVQKLRTVGQYSGSNYLEALTLEESPVNAPDFTQMVRDALSHYWGGPKLSSSPLVNMRIVQDALDRHDGNATRALRSVLAEAIENMRPDGERHVTATEWLLYNILELKFIQGYKVRDVAQRLAMSESDLYRKQRIAIEAVAKTLSEMEQEE